MAVEAAGDIFVSDTSNNRVVEVPPSGPPIAIDPKLNGVGLDFPHGLPLHSAGDLLIANLEGGSLVKVPSDGGAATNVESITRPY